MNTTGIGLDPPGATHAATAMALIVAATAMLAGVCFGFLAWQRETLPYGACAVILLFAPPALALAAILARNFPDTASESIQIFELLERLRRLDASLRALRLARAHVYVGASYAVVLGVSQAGGMIASLEFVLFYAAAMLTAAAAYLPWTAREEHRLLAQRNACRSLLIDRKAERAWGMP